MRAPVTILVIVALLTACGDPHSPVAPRPDAARLGAARADVATQPAYKPHIWYASPLGKPTNKGLRGHSWDLQTALDGGNGKVQPGDIILLRRGTYIGQFTSTLTGTPDRPIIVRQYPGERATIDGGLYVNGAYGIFWGFEIMQSNPFANPNLSGLETHSPWERFVNLVIHDAGNQGVTFGRVVGYSELYGSLIYDNGTQEGLDHGVYATNDGTVEKYILDNVVFDNMAYGIQVFADPPPRHPLLSNIDVEGNVSFDNGTISASGPKFSNLLIGGAAPTQNMTAIGNMLYFAPTANTGQNLRLGLRDRSNANIVAKDNYVVGGQTTLTAESWQLADIEGNTFVGGQRMTRLTGNAQQLQLTGNTYHHDPADQQWGWNGFVYDFGTFQHITQIGLGDQAVAGTPTETRVFVRPNKYEYGRANIIVYNWGMQPTVDVDVSSMLRKGDHWQVHDVEDFYGRPVASGVFNGRPITIPIRTIQPPQAAGRPGTPPVTSPAFAVYVMTVKFSGRPLWYLMGLPRPPKSGGAQQGDGDDDDDDHGGH